MRNERKREKKWQWLGEGLEPTTSQIACHALANWATESFGNFVGEFEYLSLSCQGSSQSKYQADMFSGEGTVSAKCKVQAQLLNMLQTWQLDLNLVKSGRKRGVGGSPCYNQDTVFVYSFMCQSWQSWDSATCKMWWKAPSVIAYTNTRTNRLSRMEKLLLLSKPFKRSRSLRFVFYIHCSKNWTYADKVWAS